MAQSYWWSSFGDFEADTRGLYPQARLVVAHYRRLSGLSREQVASRLGIKIREQYYSEQEGRGLDSVARLRSIRELLQIPPALLGLCDAPGSGAWWLEEYEPWPNGEDGWPNSGAVIKSYRKTKNWTQSDLADALGVQELAVRKMERLNINLNSISRRKALRFLLNIPPVLLGLDAKHISLSHEVSPAAIHKSKITLPSLNSIQEAQKELWAGYYNGHGQEELKRIDWTTLQPEKLIPLLSIKERDDYIEQISLLFQAGGNITLARANTSQVLSLMNVGIEYARISEDKDLLSTAWGRRAAALYELGEQELAEKSIREALSVASPDEAVKRYPVASRVLSCSAQDKQDRSEVFNMLDGIVENDRHQNGVDPNIVLWCRAQVYINLAENAPNRSGLLHQAENLLDRAERTAPDTLRRKLIIKLAQARAYLGLRQYDYAATMSIEAFQLMRQIKSVLYLPQFVEIYQSLACSSYASSPQCARLGLLLLRLVR